MYHHLLVPVDGSDRSVELVGHAVALAHRLGARISFVDAEHATGRTRRESLIKAEAAARALGVPCESAAAAGTQAAAGLAALAGARGCDLVMVASDPDREPGAEDRAALADAGIALLFSAAAPGAGRSRAIGVIRDDHRSLAAVLHIGMKALAAARASAVAADPVLMRCIVDYLRAFACELHHPREEEQVFARLRERSEAAWAEIDELERQHAREQCMVADLARSTEALARAAAAETPAATAALEAAVGAYAAFAWEHMGREEGVLLPAAQRHLTAADWAAIDAAFARESAREAEMRALFSRIVGLGAEGA